MVWKTARAAEKASFDAEKKRILEEQARLEREKQQVEHDTLLRLTTAAHETRELESRVIHEQEQLDHARLAAMCGGMDMVHHHSKLHII
jgi:hypothetical protein